LLDFFEINNLSYDSSPLYIWILLFITKLQFFLGVVLVHSLSFLSETILDVDQHCHTTLRESWSPFSLKYVKFLLSSIMLQYGRITFISNSSFKIFVDVNHTLGKNNFKYAYLCFHIIIYPYSDRAFSLYLSKIGFLFQEDIDFHYAFHTTTWPSTIPSSFKSIVSILDVIYTSHVIMFFPRTFQNDGSYGILMIPLCKMTTSKYMMENYWMNNNMQCGHNILILEI